MMDKNQKRRWNRWVRSRPVSVQKLIKQYPPHTMVELDDVMHYVIGYTEGDQLILSTIDPAVEYDEARVGAVYLCVSHLKEDFELVEAH